jgi:RNA polymerase sigma-70 factor (ECF subfamily)
MRNHTDRDGADERFREIFAHLGAVTAYARRRGSRDADGLAAEAMTIAWRRLDDVPADDARPWLYATARNLLLAERRQAARAAAVAEPDASPEPELAEIDPTLARGLRSLSPTDREALLLIAWEELTPSEAARALGINAAAFRVRLLRARRRLRAKLDEPRPAPHLSHLDVEGT